MRAHAAFGKLLGADELAIPCGVVLSRLNVGAKGKVVHLPRYAIFCFGEVLLPEAPLLRAVLPKI